MTRFSGLVSKCFPFVFLLTLSAAQAAPVATPTWRPVIAVGAGFVSSFDVGVGRTVFATDSIDEEFYNYAPNSPAAHSSLQNVFVGVEHALNQRWSWQTGVDYSKISPFYAKGTLTQGVDVGSQDTYDYHYRISTQQFLWLNKFLYTVKEHYHPYVLVGVGAAFNNAYHYATTIDPNLTFTRSYDGHRQTAFTYALGAGVDATITEHLRLGFGYRFADIGRVSFGNASIDGTAVSGTLAQSDLYVHELLVQLTWLI